MTARRTWRDRWPATPTQGVSETRQLEPERMERVYGSVASYQRDAAMLAKESWQVISVVPRLLPGGVLRALTASWLLGRRRAAPDLVVRYRRLH